MLSKHGTLESAILSVLWKLEEEGSFTHSVKDVYETINTLSNEKKAYTTIKTVMDRLYEKNILMRVKQGRKFFYRTSFSNRDAIINSLNEIALRYCQGDIKKLDQIINSINEPCLASA